MTDKPSDELTDEEMEAAIIKAAQEHEGCKEAFEAFSATLVGKNSAVAIWFCGALAARTLMSGLPQEEFEFSFNVALEANMNLIKMCLVDDGKLN